MKTLKPKSSVQAPSKNERIAARPPASKPPAGQNKSLRATKDGVGSGGNETVMISRDYLDSLLKMNLDHNLEDRSGEGNGTNRNGEVKLVNDGTRSDHCHTVVSPSTIPGLQDNPSSKLKWKELNHTSSDHPMGPKTRKSGQYKESGSVSDKKRKSLANGSPPVEEEYFPFGRPGCGAPLRTASGHVMADLRALNVRKSQQFTTSDTSPQRVHEHRTVTEPVNSDLATNDHSGGDTVSPRFARGVGPHVDQYMLREMADKRKKELEHKVRM